MNYGIDSAEEVQVILIFNNIIKYLRSRRLLFWIITIVPSVIVLCVFYAISTYTIAVINIKYNDNIAEVATLYSISKNNEDKKISPIIDNLYLIKRDSTAVRATTDHYSTIKELQSNTPIKQAVTINIYKDKNATKYSGNNLGCMTYDGAAERLLSYSCTRPTELVEYRESSDGESLRNSRVATITSSDSLAYSVKPFQGGVLGIRMPRFRANVPTSNFLFTIDSNGKEVEARIPDSLDQSQLNSTNVVTDTTSSSQSNFLLVAKQSSKVYYSESLNKDSTIYKEYTLPSNFSSVYDTLLCSLLRSTAYCYYGYSSGPPDSRDEVEQQSKAKPGTLLVIDFSNESPVAKEYTTGSTPIDMLYVTQAGKLYVLSDNNLARIELSDKSAQLHVYATKVGSVSAGDGLYYIRNNSVYKFDDTTNESYQVFYSPKLKLSTVVSLNENIFINTYIDSMEGQRIHTYKLNSEYNDSPGLRVIDNLPIDLQKSTDISDVDLYKNKLYILVKVPITKTGANAGIDYSEYEAAKLRINELLQEKSIDIGTIPVVFSY